MRFTIKLMSTKTRLMALVILVLAAVGSYFVSLWPVLLADIYDSLSTGAISTLEQAIAPVSCFTGALVLAEVLGIARRVATDIAAADLEASARETGLSCALALPVSRVSGTLSAELATLINQGVDGCCQVFKLACNDLLPSITTVAFVTYQVACGAPPVIGACMVGYVAATSFLSFLQIRSQNGVRDRINLKQGNVTGDVAQSLSNHEGIRTMAAEGYEARRLSGSILGIAKLEKYHHRIMGGFDMGKQSVKALAFTAVLLVGVLSASSGQMTGGAVVAATMLFNQLTVPLDAVYRLLDEFASSSVKISRLAQIAADARTAGTQAPGVETAPSPTCLDGSGVVEARGLNVIAPDGHAVNSGLSFHIPAGMTFCLDGATGCGKSSLMKSLLGYFPHEGDVRLLGRPLESYTARQLADAVFYLPQQPFLFSGTIRDNLVYALDEPPADDVLEEALRLALVRPGEFGTQPLDYQLSEGGGNVSGGQRQRIAAARLFLRRPSLLFADEATASLDVDCAVELIANVKEHMALTGGSIVLITHQQEVKALCEGFLSLGSGTLAAQTAPHVTAAHDGPVQEMPTAQHSSPQAA